MDKDKAMERLDAIEREASELRKIIEEKPGLEYDVRKIYVGLYGGKVYLLAGIASRSYFRFHSFAGEYATEHGYTSKVMTSGQECLDFHLRAGFSIRAFDDTEEAFQFFIDNIQ